MITRGDISTGRQLRAQLVVSCEVHAILPGFIENSRRDTLDNAFLHIKLNKKKKRRGT
jgi:hypothetical protein